MHARTPRLCRSELARDGRKSAAFIQKARVIVNDHREQACSYWATVSQKARVIVNDRRDDVADGWAFFVAVCRYRSG